MANFVTLFSCFVAMGDFGEEILISDLQILDMVRSTPHGVMAYFSLRVCNIIFTQTTEVSLTSIRLVCFHCKQDYVHYRIEAIICNRLAEVTFSLLTLLESGLSE